MTSDAMAGDAGERRRPFLAFFAGVLAEICTIITVLIVIYGHRLFAGAQTQQEMQDFGLRAAAVVGPVFGVVYTFLLALWITRRVKGRYVTHAMLVAAGAIVFHLLGAMGAPGGFRAVYVYADLLKLAGAGLAAFIAGQRAVAIR